MKLPDGTVVPSFLKIMSTQDFPSGSWMAFNDLSLRVGSVAKSYDPSDPLNISQKYMEYDVDVQYADSNGGYSTIRYYRVKIQSLFGGVADTFRWVPRIDTNNIQQQLNASSRVLLLCANGNNSYAYIIGGLPHPDNQVKDQPFANRLLLWEYNGINAQIDKDGQFFFLRKGATDVKGNVINSTNTGSTFSFTKDNAFNVNTGQFNITTTGVKINSANDAFVKGTTYRNAESSMNQSIISNLSVLQTLLFSAGIGLITDTPPSRKAAGKALQNASDIIGQIASTIQQFENGASNYLSTINFLADS